ncbi:sensor histidine kinase [Planctomonas deserti]|uniref:sensor histidine kinase n=1 Tax=Planctomonas deserti TaxID=2144185 RepID=UPI000D3B311E|nr:ATP-binding protein [Planctomonas deserti]
MTLRRRLVLGIVALLALVSIVIGIASVAFLRGTLMAQLDRQLVQSADRALGAIEGPFGGGGGGGPDGGPGLERGQGAGTLVAIAVGDTVEFAGFIDVEGAQQTLSVDQQEQLLAIEPDAGPVSADLGGELGTYRFLAQSSSLGGTVITGLPQRDVNSTLAQLVTVIVLVTLLGVAFAAVAGTAVVRRALRPLDRVAQTATDVAALELDRGEVALAVRVPTEDTDRRTEVGKVGYAINGMLGHIAKALNARRESENRVRRFVSDASHELRTPLASIRGYAELTRMGGHELPADVVHALGRIESESTRMTAIVEDLLLLARLDEGRELERSPVDLTRVLLDAVSDAHAAGRDHEWDLDLPEEPVTVLGDGSRLHQVIVNLLANARVHTPAGTRVTTSLGLEQGERPMAVVRVADDGPGIDEKLLPTLFERFVRGDDSRSRATGSTGLGLAIVQGVVAASGGSVAAESRPGNTVFTVRLPLAADHHAHAAAEPAPAHERRASAG